MRIETALYASREGLQANGSAISVVGDNISNANTTAYKTSRIEFGDLLSEGVDGRSTDTSGTAGGGVQISAVRTIFDNGVLEFTGRELDVAIDGNGFFMTGSVEDPRYSRAGNLTIDGAGFLATADGQRIMGLQGAGTELGTINMRGFSATSSPTTAISVVGNLNSSQATSATGGVPANPATFNAIQAAAGYITNTSAYDSLGVSHNITLALSKTGVNTWVAQAYMDGGELGGTAGTPVQIGQNTPLTFGPDGRLTDASKAAAIITAAPAYGGGAAAGNFTINLDSFTQFGAQSQVAGITKDGQGVGEVKSYAFDKDGVITAQLSSGTVVQVGKLQLVDFKNRDGLVRIGSGSFKATDLAGEPTIGTPNKVGLGRIQSGSLERSTVDLADQFVTLVTYQRGYQASSQTMSATNQILRDTLQMIR
ncbi:MAG: flagellar hook protein FlgE [Proteobacteria bacterium]|nr:flagellar hook protein FlgE [Pseudomonadota bacterium]